MMLIAPFIAAAERQPEHTAFVAGECGISYGEALLLVQSMANAIKDKNRLVDQGHEGKALSLAQTRVAIALERGIGAALAILAALYAGAAYVPLDINNPPQRLGFIVADADAHCVIGNGTCPDWLAQPERWLDIGEFTFPLFEKGGDLNKYRQIPPNSLFSKGENDMLGHEQVPEPLCSQPESIAAILYTSGSTGTPKGVALSHRAMANFVNWALTTFELGTQDRIASLAPFYFDLSVFDLFAGLAAGASIYFVPSGLTLAPAKLTQWLAERQITTWYTVPSLLSFLALKGGLRDTPQPALKRILFAGEVFPTPQLISLCEQLPSVALYNLYGPTETNVCCYWPVDRQRLDPAQPIPIGVPACGSKLRIDPDSGELLVDSPNNLSGYWRDGGLLPLSDHWYRTGDKVSRNTCGELLYHGRLDRMLKCSGYRVEPAEIEAAISAVPGVTQCAVLGVQDATGGQRPAAALVLQAGHSAAEVAAALKQCLPAYMRPCKYLQLEALPILSNGKIDYVSLMAQLQ